MGSEARFTFVEGSGARITIEDLAERCRSMALGAAAAAAGAGAAARGGAGGASASRPVVLVDGRSGTGKTTLANLLGAALSAELVHLDDVYPGWGGLRAAADHVVEEVLAVGSADGRPRWRRWDWARSVPAEWHPLDPARPVVVEGCGALSRAAAARATTRIWLDGDDDVRMRRALDRDGATFARHWTMWAEQEDRFIAQEDPCALADLHLRIGP